MHNLNNLGYLPMRLSSDFDPGGMHIRLFEVSKQNNCLKVLSLYNFFNLKVVP